MGGGALFGTEIMKFGKRLKSQIEDTLPKWRDKFLAYKYLKKLVNSMSTAREASPSFGSDVFRGGSGELPNKRQKVSAGPVEAGAASDDYLPAFVLDFECNKRKMTAEESDFVDLLNAEIDKFNAFFMEQEEEYIIRQKELQDRIERLKSNSRQSGSVFSETEYNEEMIKLRKDIVNFHGEMVLLENYSALNYTGLAKILKKYDKRTGGLLRHPFIQKVLQQPFFTTEQLSKLIRECENILQSLFPDYPQSVLQVPASPSSNGNHAETSSSAGKSDSQRLRVPLAATTKEEFGEENALFKGRGDEDGDCDAEGMESIYRSTMAALRTMKEIRRGSSTYSVFSLPPLDETKSMPLCSLIPICPKN